MTFLDGLGAGTVTALHRAGAVRRYRKGATLIHDGDKGESVLVLLAGRAKVSYFDDQGDETLLAISGPGDILGEMSVTGDGPRTASSVAIDPIEAVCVPAHDFRSFLADHPDAALALARTMAERLRESSRKLVEFTRHDSLGRLAVRLLELADKYGEADGDDAVRIDLPLSQEELAGLTGSSRESVVRALKVLRDRGAIDTARRRVRILDRGALERIVR